MTSTDDLESLPSFIVAIAPPDYDPARLTAERCTELVLRNQVSLRGWSFPFARAERITAGPNSDYVEQLTDTPGFSTRHFEKWRMYRSGQFLFRGLVWEHSNEELQRKAREELEWTLHGRKLAKEPAGFLSFIMVIYWITEAYVFASRLAQSAPYATPVGIRVGYRNVDGWVLTSTQPEYSLDEVYRCERSPISIKQVEVDRLVGGPLECAAEAITTVFQQFGWMDPSPSMIEQHQRSIAK